MPYDGQEAEMDVNERTREQETTIMNVEKTVSQHASSVSDQVDAQP